MHPSQMEVAQRLEAFRTLTRIYHMQLQYMCASVNEQHYNTQRYPDEAYQAVLRGQWLNDETMYEFAVLMQKLAYCMNSHFFVQIRNRNYDNAIKWIDKVPTPSRKSLLLFPINIGNSHWTGCAIDFARKAIIYQDSMGGLNQQIAGQVLDFIYAKKEELQRITGEQIDEFYFFARNMVMEVDSSKQLRPSQSFQHEIEIVRKIVDARPQERPLNPSTISAIKFRLKYEIVEECSVESTLLSYLYFAYDMPRQTNCDDCGVYTLFFLKFVVGVTPVAICAGLVKNEARYLLCDELARGQLSNLELE